MNKNVIYKYDIQTIFKKGYLDKNAGIITFLNNFKYDYKVIENYNDCLLFDQVRKELKDVPLKEVFVLMDFNNFKRNIGKLENYPNGIKLNIDGKEITFKLFIKSNSMSRSFECYYINKEYEERITKRISFGFNEKEVSISKWAAYLGLTCSSATMCSNIHLKEDEVAIIDDKSVNTLTDCLTAISIRYLLAKLEKLENKIDNITFKDALRKELNAYITSDDYSHYLAKLSSEEYSDKEELDNLIHFINQFINLFNKDNHELKKEIKELKNKYENWRNKSVKWFPFHVKNYSLKINVFDGVGLITKKFADDILESLDSNIDDDAHYSFQIRLPFIKGMVHACNIQKFFYKHNKKTIKSIVNYNKDGSKQYVEKDISKIKMIITESQFKASKYLKNLTNLKGCKTSIEYYFKVLNQYDYCLGIANIESKEDKQGKLNYQFLTTIPFSENDVLHLIDNSKEEMKRKGEFESIRNSLLYNEEYIDLFMMDNFKDYYVSTDRFKEMRKNNITKEKTDCLIGKISVPSSRRYLSPDLLELLYFAINKELPSHEILDVNHYYAPLTSDELINQKKYSYNDNISLILRNPHYSRNEIVVSKRSVNKESERDYYFKDLYGIVMMNPLSCNAERLGGADYDGDSVLIVNDPYFTRNISDKLMIDNKYKYPFAHIPSLDEEARKAVYKNVLLSLSRTFSNETGVISNYAFKKALSNDEYYLENDGLALLTILSGLEIDSAKTGINPVLPKPIKDVNLFLKVKDVIKTVKKEDQKDNKYYYGNKEVIKEIHKNKDNHILYKIMDAIIEYEPIFKETKINKNFKRYLHLDGAYNKEEAIKVLGLVDGFNKLKCKNKAICELKNDSSSNINIIETWVKDIIQNDMPVNEFLSYFKSEDCRKLLAIYVNNQYHFLTNYEDKVNFIKNELGLSLPDNILSYVTDFNNKGYLLLYICLLYFKEISDLEINIDASSIKYSKSILELNPIDKNIAITTRDDFINYINNIRPLGDWKYDQLIEECKEYVNNNFINLTFNEIGNMLDLKTNDAIFELFGDKMVKYLESEVDNYEEE